MKHKEQDVLP